MTDAASSRGIPRRVNLFATCLVDQFAPQVGEAVVEVLERLGIEVAYIEGQTCCGQPAFNSGFRADARDVAWRFVELLEATDGPVVCPSGSCAAMVRNYYADLFRDDPERLARAAAVSERVREFTEVVAEVLEREPALLDGKLENPLSEAQATATYHKCCHLLRELHVDRQPLELLSRVDGLDLVELERADVCCGFGGAFSVKMSDISTAMLEEKVAYVEKSGADVLVAGDTGCVMHMQGGMRRLGVDVQVVHIAEVLAGRTPARD